MSKSTSGQPRLAESVTPSSGRTTLSDIRKKAVEFIEEFLQPLSTRIIKLEKIDEQWHLLAEVYEESAFIKQLGLKTEVKDRNVYRIMIGPDLEIAEFEKIDD